MSSDDSGVVVTGRFAPVTHLTPAIRQSLCGDYSTRLRSTCNKVQQAQEEQVTFSSTIDLPKKRGLVPTKRSCSITLQDIRLPEHAVDSYARKYYSTQNSWPLGMYPVTCNFENFVGVSWNLTFAAPCNKNEGEMKRRLQSMQGVRLLQFRTPCSEDTAWVFHNDY